MRDFKYKLIAPIEVIVATLLLWCVCVYCNIIDNDSSRNHYVDCHVQIEQIFYVVKQTPAEYIGLSLKDIHTQLYNHYKRKYFHEVKSASGHLKLDDNGYIVDPWGRPYVIEIYESVANMENEKCYGIRILSAGSDGKFDPVEHKGDVVREEVVLCKGNVAL